MKIRFQDDKSVIFTVNQSEALELLEWLLARDAEREIDGVPKALRDSLLQEGIHTRQG